METVSKLWSISFKLSITYSQGFISLYNNCKHYLPTTISYTCAVLFSWDKLLQCPFMISSSTQGPEVQLLGTLFISSVMPTFITAVELVHFSDINCLLVRECQVLGCQMVVHCIGCLWLTSVCQSATSSKRRDLFWEVDSIARFVRQQTLFCVCLHMH